MLRLLTSLSRLTESAPHLILLSLIKPEIEKSIPETEKSQPEIEKSLRPEMEPVSTKMRIQLMRDWLCYEGSQVFAIVKK